MATPTGSQMAAKADPTIADYEGRRWSIADGETVEIGRSSENRIRIGVNGDEEDLGTSRFAATASYRNGLLWITNRSSSCPVHVRRTYGPIEQIRHANEGREYADQWLAISFVGQIRRYVVSFELPDVDGRSASMPHSRATSRPTNVRLNDLSERELRLGAAACYDMFRGEGWTREVASYARMGELLRIRPHSARNEFDAFRRRVFMTHNAPGTVGDEAKEEFATSLYDSGTITIQHVEELEAWRAGRGSG